MGEQFGQKRTVKKGTKIFILGSFLSGLGLITDHNCPGMLQFSMEHVGNCNVQAICLNFK
jgi:hypothetical protein